MKTALNVGFGIEYGVTCYQNWFLIGVLAASSNVSSGWLRIWGHAKKEKESQAMEGDWM